LEKYRGSGGGDDGDTDDLPVLPGYFRMLTLMALFIFAHYEPAVTVMILEVGMGGRYDATNCLDMDWFQHTAVAGVTQLDYDHVRILGNTLEEIAWEKGGIFQVHKGTVASPHPKKGPQEGGQDSEVIRREVDGSKSRRFFALDTNTESSLEVLRQCARIEGEGGTLHLVGPSHQPVLPTDCKLGLPGSHQRVNAELAIALCEELEGEKRRDDVFAALANVTWPGRCQTVELPEGRTTLRLDGAHTVHSITAGLEWYQSVSQGGRRILFFNCSHERSPVELLELLMPARFECVYLCRADSERPSAVPKKSAKELLQDAGKSVEELQDTESSESPSTSWQKTLAVVWKQLEKEADHHSVEVASNLTAADALMRIKRSTNLATRNEVFVTGSLYLVGSMLTAIQWEELEAEGELRLRNR
jgi:folylpolyglutamate synthase